MINVHLQYQGVNQQLKNLSWVWDRGYYEQTKDGIWYNLFLNEKIKEEQPNIELNGDKISLSNAYEEGIGQWDKVSVAYSYSDFPESVN